MDKRLEYKLKSTSMLIVKLLTKIDFVGLELHYLLLFISYRSSVSVHVGVCAVIYIFVDSLNLHAIGQLCPRDKYRLGPRMGTKIGRDLGCVQHMVLSTSVGHWIFSGNTEIRL